MAHRQRTGIATARQSILTDDPDFLQFIVERVIQEVLEADAAQRVPAAHLHADPYERTATRTGYRNGYTPRQLNTRVGTLTFHPPARGYPGKIGTAPSRRNSSPAINATR